MSNYKTFPPNLAVEEIIKDLTAINIESGYNTSPEVGEEFLPLDKVAGATLPYLCVEVAVLQGIDQLFGSDAAATMTEEAKMGVVVYGYIEDEVSPRKGAMALTEDILAAVWADETSDGAVVGVDLLQARIFVPAMKDRLVALVAVELEVSVQFPRGG